MGRGGGGASEYDGISMRNLFKKAWLIYLFALLTWSIAFWAYMIWDDWVFVEKYEFKARMLLSWLSWYLVYSLGVSIYFWVAATAGIVIYSRLIVPGKNER
jgi:hypothetical protein